MTDFPNRLHEITAGLSGSAKFHHVRID